MLAAARHRPPCGNPRKTAKWVKTGAFPHISRTFPHVRTLFSHVIEPFPHPTNSHPHVIQPFAHVTKSVLHVTE
jgi:hypothetical protein